MRRLAALGALTLLPIVALSPASSKGGGCHRTQTAAEDSGGTVVGLRGACFSPTVIRIDEGQTVTFVNQDEGMPHVVMGTGWGTGDEIPFAGSAEFRFDSKGTYPYSCFYHPGMNGVIVVGDGISTGGVSISTIKDPKSNSSKPPTTDEALVSKTASETSADNTPIAAALVILSGLAGFGLSKLVGRRAPLS